MSISLQVRVRALALVFVSLCVSAGAFAFGSAPALAAAPEAPEALKPEPIRATAATLQGIVNPKVAVFPVEPGTYQFEYKATKTATTAECESAGASKAPASPGMYFGLEPEHESQLVSGLIEGTEYIVCVAASTVGGTTVGSPFPFKTGLKLETPVNAKVKAGSIAAASAEVEGELNPGKERKTDQGYFEIIYKVSALSAPPTGECEESATHYQSTSGVKEEQVAEKLTGLQPNAKYTFCLRVGNEDGETATGVPVTFTTPPAPPAIESESVSLPVKATEGHLEAIVNPNNEATECHFQYEAEEPLLTAPTTALCEPPSFPASFGGQGVGLTVGALEADKTYYYRVVAKNAAGETKGTEVAPIKHFETALPPETPNATEAKPVAASEATLHGVLNPALARSKEPGSYEFRYRPSATECQGGAPGEEHSTPATPAPGLEKDAPAQAVVTGLSPGTQYTFCLLSSNEAGEASAASPPVTFTTPGVPVAISEEFSENVLQTSATLHASINPNGADTTYHFEYDIRPYTEGEGPHGTSIPAAGLDIGAGNSPVPVSQYVTGLNPNTTYHYRIVAASSLGTAKGTDHTFTTSVSVSDVLPDERQYELVSPPNKNGGEIDGGVHVTLMKTPQQAAEDGSAVMYASSSGFEDAPNQPEGNLYSSSYLSKRGPDGWTTENITPPIRTEGQVNAGGNQGDSLQAMGETLSGDFLISNSGLLPDAFDGFSMPYIRESASGTYRDLSPSAPRDREPGQHIGLVNEGDFVPFFAGASSNFSHIAFSANGALTPNAVSDSNPFGRNLYEWSNGQLRLVNILPDGEVLPVTANPVFGQPRHVDEEFQEELNTVFSGESPSTYDHVMSNDGSRVFWTDTENHELLARVNGTSTVRISQSQKTNGSVGEDDGAEFQAASTNGSQVFFTSKAELTNNAKPTRDLYRYSMETGQLSDITPGAEILDATIPSDNGAYAYFVSNNVLAEGASPGDCSGVESFGYATNFCNVYVWHEGTGIRFITRLPESYANGQLFPIDAYTRSARVSPDGRFFAFEAEDQPAPYNGMGEVFLYDAQGNGGAGSLVCASCNPSGDRPLGPSRLPGRVGGNLGAPLKEGPGDGWKTPFYQSRYLDDNGRLFFESWDALSPRDTNGQQDVYEYEPSSVGSCTASEPTFDAHIGGCVDLISGGFGPEPSQFYDASASGDDVFFVTRDQLALADKDQAVDMYDARVGGTPNIATPPPCASSDACKPGPTPQPSVFGAPASATFNGAGNVTASAIRVSVAPKKKSKAQIRTEKLKRALKICKSKPRSKRRGCEARARANYGILKKAKRFSTRSTGRTK